MKLDRLTVARLQLPAGKPEMIIFDESLPGFGIRLRAGGKKSWVTQYRLGAKQRRITIGSLDKIDPDQARKQAKTILAKVLLGADPQSEKIEARARASVTLESVTGQYLAHAKGRLKERSYEEVERHLRKHWAPLKELALHRVHRANVAARISEIAKENGPVAANRARASLSGLFTWAMRDELAEVNPVVGTNKATEERSRDRVLADAELVEVWRACREDDHGRVVRLLILTGQRREEVGGMSDAEIDLEKRLWIIPRERTKNGLPHEVPLSDLALQILRDTPRRGGRTLIFGERAGSFQGWSRAKSALDRRILDDRMKHKRDGQLVLAPWVLHDLRRTVATRMADLGVQPHVIEAVLNHISGHKGGVAGIYNRSFYAAEKRQALNLWAAHVQALVDGQASNVITIRAAIS